MQPLPLEMDYWYDNTGYNLGTLLSMVYIGYAILFLVMWMYAVERVNVL